MTDPTGTFFWYELMTSDPEAALAFYGDVIGWTSQPFPGGDPEGGTYHVVSGSAGPMGGIMAIPAEAKDCGISPWWGGYIGSTDVDADAARLAAAGGKVMRPAEDIPGVGRFAVMADPGGAVFMLLKGSSPEGFEGAPPMAAGHVSWHELSSGDYTADLAFYTGQFGWTKGDAMDMGEMGTYQLLSQTGGTAFESMTGAIMPRPPMIPQPFWLFYFSVNDIDIAHGKIEAGGGRVMNGPMEVPGGGWIIQATDPQGAAFAVVGMRKAA
jgi:predicted enzyme related to lactoylglutathione lyase